MLSAHSYTQEATAALNQAVHHLCSLPNCYETTVSLTLHCHHKQIAEISLDQILSENYHVDVERQIIFDYYILVHAI